jgi:hypothetical protein
MVWRGIVRVTFKTKLPFRMDVCVAEDSFNQGLEIFWRKERWGSSTQMKFPDDWPPSKNLAVLGPFSKYGPTISLFHRMIFSDSRIACTIGTQAFAKWQMNVKAYTFCFIRLLKRPFDGSMPSRD